MNPCPNHRITFDPDKEGRGFVLDEVLVEVKFAF
jgi:hypothetical protein